ncbi:MAG: putative porin [Bacteroidota bacterium]
MLFRGSLALALALVCFTLSGQITDDSTTLVYGPSTLYYIYESDLKNNTEQERSIDTTLFELENWRYYDQMGRFYQNLGNNGTAMAPIFPELPTTIGKRSGLHTYDYLFTFPSQLKYYNTKSPFIDAKAVFGGRGRSTFDLSYSVNISPTWNAGFDLQRMASDKQIGAEQTQGDRNSIGTGYDIYTYYEHPEQPYKLLFNFTARDQNTDETGGVFVESDDPLEFEFFRYLDSPIRLQDAVGGINYSNVHLYHEYALFKQFQVYHQFDRFRQRQTYEDHLESGAALSYSEFYDRFLFDEDSTQEKYEFRELTNEVGLKGTIASVFYRFYARRRDIDFDYIFFDPAAEGENYIGGLTRLDWKSFSVQGEAELMATGELMFKGSLDSDLLFASFTSMRYKPSYLADRYFGNHNEWRNRLDAGFTNELFGGLKLRLGPLSFVPTVRLTNLDEFIYFDQSKTARQATGAALVSRFGGDLNLTLSTNRERGSAFHFENQVFYTTVAGDARSLIPVPEFFYNGRHYWRGNIFQQSVPVEIGLNVHSRSAYAANDYDPVTQQFHLQDDFDFNEFLSVFAVDVFLNMRIDKIFAFVKITHANQSANSGYMVTPLYPGQPRVFDLGVRWLFFD